MEVVKIIAGVLLSLLFAAGTNQGSDTPYVTVSVNYTPRSSLGNDSSTIVLINQFDINQLKTRNQKKREVMKAGAYSAVKYAESQLKQLPHIKVINLVDSATFAVNTDSIRQIAAQYHAGHVLALNNFDADIVLSDAQSSTPYFDTDVRTDFTLYEANGVYYRKLKGSASDLLPEVKYNFGFYGALYIHPPIERYKSYIDTSAQNAAVDALKDYLPSASTHDRPLYNDHFLKKAVEKIYANDLAAATALLKPELQNKNNKKASKAAYNLSVVYEAKGDINAAMSMARLSINKFNNDFASAILADLKLE